MSASPFGLVCIGREGTLPFHDLQWMNKSDISSKKSQAFEHSDPLKFSPGSHSLSASCSVGIWVTACFWHFCSHPLCLHCLCSSVSRSRNCARLLTVATPVLKAAVKSTKVKLHGNSVRNIYVNIAHMISVDAQTNKQTRHGKCKAILGPAATEFETQD